MERCFLSLRGSIKFTFGFLGCFAKFANPGCNMAPVVIIFVLWYVNAYASDSEVALLTRFDPH